MVQPMKFKFGPKKREISELVIDRPGIPLGFRQEQMRSSVLNEIISKINKHDGPTK